MRRLLLIGLVAGLAGCTNQLPVQDPAAGVLDGHAISMRTYEARLEVSRQRAPVAGLTTSPSSSPSAQRLEDFTIQQLIREEIIWQEADRRKIHIRDGQVDSRIVRLRGQAGATAFDAALGRNGFTAASFYDYQRAFLTEMAAGHALGPQRAASAHGAPRPGAGLTAEEARWGDGARTPLSGGRVRLAEA